MEEQDFYTDDNYPRAGRRTHWYRHLLTRPRFRQIRKAAPVRPRMKILDVGCGEGTLVRLLESEGPVGYGVDINADAVRTAQHPRVAQASAVELPFADGSFDLCVGSHVIEHMEFPRDFLSELARVVKRSGRIVLIYPWEPIQGMTIVPDVLFSGQWPRRSLLHRIHRQKVNPKRLRRFTRGTGLRHEHSSIFLGLPHLSFQYLTVLTKRR